MYLKSNTFKQENSTLKITKISDKFDSLFM